jgi:hypothetical protein
MEGGIGGLLALCGLVCWFVILIDAFKREVWKGLASLLCGLYMLYYAFFEFEHKNKWLIVLGLLFFGSSGVSLLRAYLPY